MTASMMAFANFPKTIQRLAAAMSIFMAVVLGAQLAWWSWHFFGPAPVHESITADVSIDLSQARALFGEAGESVAAASTPVENNSGIRLKGVFAVDGVTLSTAVINTGARDFSVQLNEKITDNTTLVDVKADYIVVSRAGVRETIALDRIGAVVAKSAAGSTAGNANVAASNNFRLNVSSTSRNAFALSRGELNTVLQDPRQINYLGSITSAPNGGVQVQDATAGSLANKLGLQPGDIITQINGQPVNGAGDLARFYGQFGSTSSVRAEVKRNGTPMQLTYTINQ